jgi:hypothetical protein
MTDIRATRDEESVPVGYRKYAPPDIRRARARAAVSASKGTGDILPREIYQIAEVPVPPEATDELQKAPLKRMHWWSRKKEYRPFY